MSQKQYLIYLDILGFDRLAAEIAEKKGIESRKVREDFLSVIRDRVETIEERGMIAGSSYGRRDDWLLVTDDLDKVFTSIVEILDHNTGYVDYERIPLEIAVGTAEFDRWARLEAEKLIIEPATIEFLNTYIVHRYHKWYEQFHDGQKVRSTFVILTESAYGQLEPLDRKMCRRIEYEHNHKAATFFDADVNRVRQRGRVFEFLEKIGHGGSELYDRIDDIYVPPLEYEDIVRTLQEKRLVVITGTPEYGKTYTAVRLMWQYYNRGYEPRWVRGGEEGERINVRQQLEDVGAGLKPRHIIYFEDPFGKRRYERRGRLERQIGTIVERIKQVEDSYVIITSWEEVFKEFEKEQVSADGLREFENTLNIGKPSYDYENRKGILLKWAEAKNCKWLGNKKLKNLALQSIRDRTILPTLLSIYDFIMATIHVEEADQLREQLGRKSIETEKEFAIEIGNMTEDKILFLSFMFVSTHLEVEFVREVYQELVEELGSRDAWEFDRIRNWFKPDKIKIIYDKYLDFSHPSYSRSLEHLLVEDGYITWINRNIFSKLLLKLSEKDAAASAVAGFVVGNFDRLPKDVRIRLLLELSEKDDAARVVAGFVAENFDRLPKDVRHRLLLELSEKDEAVWGVATALAENFGRLPEDVRNRLLLELSEKDEAAWAVARAVADNFDRLPKDVRNLLFKLSERDGAAAAVAGVVGHCFGRLPEDVRDKLLLELSEKDRAARVLAGAVADNFDRLPEDVRNRLLLELSEKGRAAWTVARAVAENFDRLPEDVRNLLFKLFEKDEAGGYVAGLVAHSFDRLPEDVRNRLLLELSEKDEAAWAVARAVAENFDRLPEDVRNLLFKLSEKDEAVTAVARAVADNFERLPEDVRNRLLLELSEKDEAAWVLAGTVAENFDRLPEDVRNLLFKLSKKDEAAWDVARVVAHNFDRLPGAVRNRLLLELSEKDEAAWVVAGTVADNFDTLPKDVRNRLLLELSEKDEGAWVLAGAVAENFDRLPEDVRNLLFKLSKKDRAADAVARVVAHSFDRLPEDVRNRLLLELSEKDEAAWAVARAVAENFDRLPEDVRNLLDRLQAPLQQVIEAFSGSGAKEEALHLISRTLPKINLDFLSRILDELSKCENETVRTKAAQMLRAVVDDSNGDEQC